jgi:membrane protease YdiL (CAAX protease family)
MSQATPFPPAPPRLPGIGGALAVIVLYFALQVGIGSALYLLAPRLPGMNGADLRALLVILTVLASTGLVAWTVRALWPFAWRQAAPPGFGLSRAGAAPYYALAVLLGLALPVFGSWLTQWLARGHAVSQDIKELGGTVSLGLRLPLALLVATVGPLVEELLFRGLLLSALLRRVPAGWAVAASSLLFALVHLPDLGFLWYAVPNLALLAAVLAWLRLRSGSLWPAVLAHGVNNLLALAAWFTG